MKIAVIGAGISGLAAGRELARTGHYVVVFEENSDYGGKLATLKAGKNKEHLIDFGIPYIESESGEFGQLLKELQDKDLLRKWEGKYAFRNREGEIQENKKTQPAYFAPKGMNSIGKYLGRSLDIRFNEKVGGITNIGDNRIKKRTWMLNFPTAATENFDAVIIAAPARQAYGILNLTADEREALRLISIIDEVNYTSQFSFVAGYGDISMPEWNILECEDEAISRISNESLKGSEHGNTLVIYSSLKFAEQNAGEDKEVVEEKLLKHLSKILGGWAALPEWKHLYFWKYAMPSNPLPYDYLEFEDEERALALVGGYMNGNNMETAYLSGLRLGQHWVKKFSNI